MKYALERCTISVIRTSLTPSTGQLRKLIEQLLKLINITCRMEPQPIRIQNTACTSADDLCQQPTAHRMSAPGSEHDRWFHGWTRPSDAEDIARGLLWCIHGEPRWLHQGYELLLMTTVTGLQPTEGSNSYITAHTHYLSDSRSND